jgi:putative ABC transport system permease protein
MRFVLRSLWRHWGFAAAVIPLLALGIGATTAMFTIVNGVVFQPLPYPHASRLVFVSGATTPPGGDAVDWWGQGSAFAALAQYLTGGATVEGGNQSIRVSAAAVTPDFFSVFTVPPALGRGFVHEDFTRSNPVVVISHQLWVGNLGGDPGLVGKEIILNAMPYTVVGIMPPAFGFPGHTDVWLLRLGQGRPSAYLGSDNQPDLPIAVSRTSMIGRLNDGATLKRANIELSTLNQKLKQQYSGKRATFNKTVSALPMDETLIQNFKPVSAMLVLAVSLLFAVVCVNATNMFTARTIGRRKDLAIRLCLGASRWALMTESFGENLLVTVIAGIAGTVLAALGVHLIRVFGPRSVPRLMDVRLDTRALLFAFILCVVIAFFVALVSTLVASRIDPVSNLKGERVPSIIAVKQPMRKLLVVCEIALTFALLAAAETTVENARLLSNNDPGFAAHNVLTLDVALPMATYRPAIDAGDIQEGRDASKHVSPSIAGINSVRTQNFQPPRDRAIAFYEAVRQAFVRTPGVSAAGAIDLLPLGGRPAAAYPVMTGSPRAGMVRGFAICGDYLGVMGVPLLGGRAFNVQDRDPNTKVAIISRMLAAKLWPSESAVGKQISLAGEAAPREIVGVVGEVKYRALDEPAEPATYVPCSQPYSGGGQLPVLEMTLVAKTEVDPRSVVASLRSSIFDLDKDVGAFQIRTMDNVISDSVEAVHFREVLLLIFADLALVLAVLGVYGVIALAVGNRTHEIGVRIALGAQPRSILRMVCAQGLFLGLTGVTIGAGLTWSFHRLLANSLTGVLSAGWLALVAPALLLISGAILSSLYPAIRASRTDPVAALRLE